MSDLLGSPALPTSKQHKAPTKLNFPTMMAICVGLVVAQGVMISATQGIGLGGTGFIVAMLIALVLAQFNAMSFAELALLFPEEGTLATYTQKAIGHFPAIVAVFSGYVAVGILALPVEMFLVDAMLAELFGDALPARVVPILLLITLTLTNLVGADVFAKVQNFFAFVLVCALLLTGLAAVTGVLAPHPELAGKGVDWSFTNVANGNFLGLIVLALWLLVGVEFICPLINEVAQPEKNIPRAMHGSLFLIFAIFLVFAIGAGLYLDATTLTESPIPYLDYANAVFGRAGVLIATIMAIAATCSTMNTVFASVPRMLHGMAHHQQAFPQLKAENRFQAPWLGILMMAGCTLLCYLLFSVDSLLLLVIAATTCWLLAYIVAHIDVLVLRWRLPDRPRPYRTPFYPLPQVLGIFAMIYVALHNSPSPELTRQVYFISGGILLFLATVGACWVKFYMKRGLFEADMD